MHLQITPEILEIAGLTINQARTNLDRWESVRLESIRRHLARRHNPVIPTMNCYCRKVVREHLADVRTIRAQREGLIPTTGRV